MEVSEMKDGKTESQMTSAAAFVEGGIQEACEDACSICLEDFCESDPSTVTTCKHNFHLQCILEWCQRSSQCPMCMQSISLKDPTSQELLEALVHERNLRSTPSRNAAMFRHPAFGGFELQHQLSMGENNSNFEEQIIQHLAAAAMAREHHLSRREGSRSRSSAHGHPHFLVFSTQPSAPPSGPVSAAGWGTEPAPITIGNPSAPLTPDADETPQHIPHLQTQITSLSSGSTVRATHHRGSYSIDRGSAAHSSSSNLDRAGPSEFQSFSGSLRSKLSAVSMGYDFLGSHILANGYKESISKGTREWKERLFSRTSSMSDLGSEVKRELNAGIASVSRLMERLETRDNNRPGGNHLANPAMAETSNQNHVEAPTENSLTGSSTPAACTASSHSN